MNKHQQLITRVRAALHRTKLQEKLAAAREKAVLEQANAAVELFCDDLRQEGIEPLSDLGRLLIAAFVASTSEETARPESIDPELDAFDKNTGRENW